MSLVSVRFLEDCTGGRRSDPTCLKNPTVAGGRLVEPKPFLPQTGIFETE